MRRADLPADLDSLVEGRGASLFRTAVLLLPNRDAAIRLVARALVKAARGRRDNDASPEARVRDLMVGDFVRSHRRAPEPVDHELDSSETADQHALADPLAGTSVQQRALLVLGAHHQLSPERSARVLGISARRAASERQSGLDLIGVDQISQLTVPLRDVAESYAAPTMVTLQRAVTKQQPAARRRTRVRWMLVTGAVAAGVVTMTVFNGPPEGLSETVEAAQADPDYTSGYGLVDGRPRPFVDGLKLEKTDIIDYSQRRKIIAAPHVDPDTQLYAVAYCDLPGNAMDVVAIVNAVTVEAVPGGVEADVVDLSCLDRGTDLRSSPLAKPLPRGVDEYAVTVPSVWSGAGAMHLALYSEAPWSTYPFPAFVPADSPPADLGSGEVIDANTPPDTSGQLSWLTETDDDVAEVYSMDVDVATALQISTLTQEPGQLLIALDGVVLTNDGEELAALGEGRPGPWQQADPALRQGFWRGYSESGYHRYLDSSALLAMGVDITDDRVRVSVIPRGFSGEGWQVIAASDAKLQTGELTPLAPGYASTLPQFAHGLERVGVFSVPADGREYEVPLPVDQSDSLTWIGACNVETTISIRTVTMRSPTRTGLIPCASYRNEWAAPLTPGTPGPPLGADEGQPEVITLSAPNTAGSESLTIGAYRSVPYEEFPFQTGDQPSTAQLNLRPVPDEGDLIGLGLVSAGTRWQSADQVTATDLDAAGTARLDVPTEGQALIGVSTSGVGRFRVSSLGPDGSALDGNFKDPSVLGRVASSLMYRDGWWTSWTTEETQWTIPIPPGRGEREAGLEVEVQGYQAGSVEMKVLVARPDGGDEGG